MLFLVQNVDMTEADPGSASASGTCDNDASYEDSFVSEVSSLYLSTPEKRAKQSLTAVYIPQETLFCRHNKSSEFQFGGAQLLGVMVT